ncbi:variant SH3 domain-containing protein 5 [Elsinoe australis]|uniref:Variant SH3 domain-containing protein 5 n=1 Tax=Elsinoe australis TaxID=40998 RepID=A0A4V6DT58_9PEZI|nr:variant SH3 domain-containing protein 5 [Elsinoe australis]
MAARQGTDPQQVPPGSMLIVIHDFVARSPDELSLTKGDRIELIERDDDFGDGWFLGKHLTNGNTGLFPEVYTRPAPKGVSAAGSSGMSKVEQEPQQRAGSEDFSVKNSAQQSTDNARLSAPESMHSASMIASQNPVMNETLDVIKEHINDMNTPRQSLNRGPSHDSASVYAPSHSTDPRASYIRGHETDEEDSPLHTEQEILTWTPARVAEYLEDKGVEKQHCDVFREQEISGEVLLNMEQSSVFIKEFDLGSVGRRLKTWQKVRALQDEVRASSIQNVPRSVSIYSAGGDEPIDGALVDPARQRSSSMASANFLSPNMQQGQKMQMGSAVRSNTIPYPTQSYSPQQGSPLTGRPDSGAPRPSAHSIRTMQHSRRHSSLGSDISAQRVMLPPGAQAPVPSGKVSHERTRSSSGFDPAQAKRASKFGHGYSLSSSSQISQAPADWGLGPMGSPQNDLDRGYFSGNEVDKRNNRRSVLQKKPIASASHSRNPSESTDNVRASYQSQPKVDSPLSPAIQNNGLFSKMKGNRSASSPKTFGKTFPNGPTSPVVTRLDYDQRSPALNGSEASSAGQSPSAGTFSFFSKPKVTGLRVASDNVTTPSQANSTTKPSPLNSPTRTGSTTPSTESRSIDHAKSDPSRLSTGSSQGLQQPPVTVLPAPRTRPRARSKKFTSAYTRGLEKKSPRDQIIGSDYSGWMKKKSASLVGTWKPRLFVLRGRRLSYYYSENDTEEKGLIDISGHRVLPAENDRMTGLHATLTGAKSPQSATAAESGALTTSAAADLKAGKGGSLDSDEGLFIFKLVPPRQGMSKAVNFTKPVVHYFAVGSRQEGRLWMAALMKATIDYDASGKVTTSYNQPTISLKKARERRERPPALMEGENGRGAGLEEVEGDDGEGAGRMDSVGNALTGKGLGIGGLEDGDVEVQGGAEEEGRKEGAALVS